MSTTQKQPDYSNLLKDIAEFYEDNAVEVHCPSLKHTLKFKPLSVRQLKVFMALQVNYDSDEVGFDQGLKILKEINNILNENSLNEDVDINTALTVLDRDVIILQLRANTNPIAEIEQEGKDTEKVDLAEVVDRIKGASLDKKLKSTTKVLKYNNSNITLNLELPALLRDTDINDYFANKLKGKVKTKKDFEKNASAVFAQIYLVEMFKYIKSVNFNKTGADDKSDTNTEVDFYSTKNIRQNVELLESLPTNVVAQITSYVTDIKSYRDSLLHFIDKDGKEVPLDIDANIFIGI